MSVTVKELAKSRRGSHELSNPWAEFLYSVRGTGTAEEADAYHAVLGVSWPGPELEWPLEDNTTVMLTRLSVGMDPVAMDERDDPTESRCLWRATVRYGFPRGGTTSQPDGEPWAGVVSFDTGGGTQHIKQSLETTDQDIRLSATPSAPPNHKGAIGVTADSVEGVDIAVAVFDFEETHQFPVLTVSHVRALFDLTGCVNADADPPGQQPKLFRMFAPGECLFRGASAVRRGTGVWEVRFQFAASPNRTIEGGNPIKLPGFHTDGMNKMGWEYLWVSHVDEKDDAAKKTALRPYGAYVERVYEAANFDWLLIG